MSRPPGTLLVAGIPRSGTTWTGSVLSRAARQALVHEPDNEKEYVSAFVAKRELGRFPVLERYDDAAAYERLWATALAGTMADSATRRGRVAARLWRRLPIAERERALAGAFSIGTRTATALVGRVPAPGSFSPVVAKSVHAPLALEWLADRFAGVQVVVVIRHPASVLSSWLEMELADQDRGLDRNPLVQRRYLDRWSVRPPGPAATALDRAAWQVCLLTAALLDAAGRHPEWQLVRHEDLCRNPMGAFESLSGKLGLNWNDDAQDFLRGSDRAGEGFAVNRRSQDEIDRWRRRIGPDATGSLTAAAAQFPGLEHWHADLREHAATGQG